MPLDWSPFTDLVHRHQRFLLTTHIRPDGDGLGSMLALSAALEARGKQTRLVVASIIPPRYDFLDPERRIQRFSLPGEEYRDAEAILVLDTGTWNQLGDFGTFMKGMAVPKLVIDHHQTQDDLGGLRLVDTTAEATGRLIAEAIRALDGSILSQAADPLFTALAMDTGWFHHANTTAASFDLAGDLVRAGAQPPKLYEQLYDQNTLGRYKLMGLVLDRLQLAFEGRVAYTEIHRDDYARTGALPPDSEDMVNFTRGLGGVQVGILFMEQPRGGIKVSFRARAPLDVAKVAERFGGGGHKLASGAVVEAPLAEVRQHVLEAVFAALNQS